MPELTAVFQTDYIRWVTLLIITDWILGVVVAFVKKTFRLANLAYYLHDAILPYVFVFAIVQLIAQAQPDLSFIVPVSFVMVVAALIGNIVGNLEKLGLPVPKFLKKD